MRHRGGRSKPLPQGTFFPVQLREVFKNGRYRVLHKLGWGGYATIWLARDTLNNSNVALKFISKDVNPHELEIMRHLRDSPIARANATHPGRKFVIQLLDDFDVSPSQQCLVLEVMGRSIAARGDACTGGRLPRSTARKVTYQMALGLDYLWKCHVAHGDLYGGNVLFAAPPSISALSEVQLRSHLSEPEVGAVQRRDGAPLSDPSIPPYLVLPSTFRGCDAEIRIVDLGGAFFHDAPPKELHTPIHMRPPEALYNRPLSASVDMWSMGCLFFEIITGHPFICPTLANRTNTIQEIHSHIGPAPAAWISQLNSDTVRKSINSIFESGFRDIELDQYLRIAYAQDDDALYGDIDEDDIPIMEYEKAKCELTDAELDALSATLAALLAYDPAWRCPPEALLQSPWFWRGFGG